MPDHPLITGEAAEAANPRTDLYLTEFIEGILAAFLAHVEGERPCERCEDEDWLFERAQSILYGTQSLDWDRHRGLIYERARASCPDCHGTGKVRADRLVSLNAVVEALRGAENKSPDTHIGYIAASYYIERLFKEDDRD